MIPESILQYGPRHKFIEPNWCFCLFVISLSSISLLNNPTPVWLYFWFTDCSAWFKWDYIQQYSYIGRYIDRHKRPFTLLWQRQIHHTNQSDGGWRTYWNGAYLMVQYVHNIHSIILFLKTNTMESFKYNMHLTLLLHRI